MATLKSILLARAASAAMLATRRAHVSRAARADVFPLHRADDAGRRRLSAGAGDHAARGRRHERDRVDRAAEATTSRWCSISTAMAARWRIGSARFRRLVDDGTGLVALSYRGYGGSEGSPTEEGLIADARAAYDFARREIPMRRSCCGASRSAPASRLRSPRRRSGRGDPGIAVHLDRRRRVRDLSVPAGAAC